MEKNEYLQKSRFFLEKIIRLDNEFNSLVREYYHDTPKEKGKKRTDFYKVLKRFATFASKILKNQI